MTKQQTNITLGVKESTRSESNSQGFTLNLKGKIVSRPFGLSVDNFYVTDFVCENSAIMAKATKVRLKNNFFKEKSIYN